jgi:hypothetical protein
MNLKVIEQEHDDWTYLGQDTFQWRTLVNTVMNLPGSMKYGIFLDQLNDCQFLKIILSDMDLANNNNNNNNNNTN